jgi:protein SCO1/2
MLLWVLVAFAGIGAAALLLTRNGRADVPHAATAQGEFGVPFTLTASDGKPFSSSRLSGKPYAMFFGFTRCGDVCPTTLARLAKLRREAGGDDALNIVFVTIDPENDGPREVGQYAELFDTPIIGLTGTPQQIGAVKKQYGIYAEPVPHAPTGQQMSHTGSVLLFGRDGRFAGTLSADESDRDALAKLEQLVS